MSTNNASNSNSSGSFSLMNLCGRVIFNGSNFNDWIRNIRMAIRYEEKEYVLDKELKEIDEETAPLEQLVEYRAHEGRDKSFVYHVSHYDFGASEVLCGLLAFRDAPRLDGKVPSECSSREV